MKRPIITLTTDFGTKDGYVGAVKGVIKKINPEAELIGITHEIEPFDILGAAFALNNFYRYFPKGSIHLVAVDPGVGSERQALLIKSEDFFFVGPDNGVFNFIFENERINEIIVLSNKKYFLATLSSTFHTRDIFAPVAAYLSLGIDIREFGNSAEECVKLLFPQPSSTKKSIVGEIIHIDNFGNLITNIGTQLLDNKNVVHIDVEKKKIKQISQSYFDVPKKEVGAVIGSSGFLEISMNQGSAAKALNSKIGLAVKVSFRSIGSSPN